MDAWAFRGSDGEIVVENAGLTIIPDGGKEFIVEDFELLYQFVNQLGIMLQENVCKDTLHPNMICTLRKSHVEKGTKHKGTGTKYGEGKAFVLTTVEWD